MENCHGVVYDVACVGVGDLVQNTQMPLPRTAVGKVKNHTGYSDFLTAPSVDPVAYSTLGMGYSLEWEEDNWGHSGDLDPPMLAAIEYNDGLDATGGPPTTLRLSSPQFREPMAVVPVDGMIARGSDE